MSHQTYPASPQFGVQEPPEHSIQDRLRATESTLNNQHVRGSGTKQHPSHNVHGLQVNSQGEARTAFNLRGFSSSPRPPQPSPRFTQYDKFRGELDRTSNGDSNSSCRGTGSGIESGSGKQILFTQPPKSPYYRQPGTLPSVSQHQLERLAVGASSIDGVISGPYPPSSEASQHYEADSLSNPSATSPLSGGSSKFASGAIRDTPQTLLSVPGPSNNIATTLSPSPMLPSQFNRSIPRTSSIDSAISSVSRYSSDGSNNNGSANSAPTPADIQTLIHAAGSAEALIGYMLKEKASAATQNTQLWKLVDKQRAMILGLNKDLEMALKDKNRYRKKLKEQLGVVPPIPSLTSTAAIVAARVANESSGAEDHPDSPVESYSLIRSESMPLPKRGNDTDSGLEIALAPYPSTSPQMRAPGQSPMERVPSPSTYKGSFTPESVKTPIGSQHSDSSSKSSYPEHGDGGNAPLSPREGIVHQLHGSRVSVETDNGPSCTENTSFMYPASSAKIASRAHHLMKLGISTNVSPASGLGKSPLRKAPPAPLALPPLTETKLHTDDENDGDDDDNMSIDEIPGYQNRKDAELAMTGEIAAEDAVTKERTSTDSDRRNSWEHSPIDKEGLPHLSLPRNESSVIPASSPWPKEKQVVSLVPPVIPNTKPFSPGLGDGFAIRQQFIRVPEPSPGLPSSPRPIDRPLNSPKPRQRPQSPASPRIGPLSPNLGIATVPLQLSTPRGLIPQSVSMPIRSPLFGGHEKSDSITSQQSLDGPIASLIILPTAIPSIDCRVVSSRMKPSRASMIPGSKSRVSENDSVFTLGVFARATGEEILRVEKDVGALPALDAVLRKYIAYNAKVPDRALFAGHAPARIDSRRVAVDEYFAGVLGATMDERAALALCQFFSTDVVDHIVNNDVASSIKEGSSIASDVQGKPVKEGYLTKRGKNFGGWKARYFILNCSVLKYYESPGGAHMGQIKLQSAQIGRQSQSQKVKESVEEEADTESQYRHAFLILEPKRKDSSTLVRHVLCAESDTERDEWVEALMQYVDKETGEDVSTQSKDGMPVGREKKKRYGPKHKDSKDSQGIEQDKLHALGYEQTTPGPEPARGPTPEELQKVRNTPSPQNSITSSVTTSQPSVSVTAQPLVPALDRNQAKQISAPTNGSVISDLAAWGAKLAHSEQKAAKKRSIWGFRQRTSSDLDNQQLLGGTSCQHIGERLNRSIFGATLEEAVHLSKPIGVMVHLPAVVYRCIEYLEAKDAASEEGIFRLSGSNVVIKGLRERFNTESDFNLLNNDEYYDVHAVAGLLKLYLRELPTNVLTTERREEFVKVTEMDDEATKIIVLNELVHSLPIENFELLRALSGHLLHIVENSDVNKMTIRNVGIVFSPTVNIPAQVFSMFLHQYRHIFVRPDDNLPDDRDIPRSPFRETHEDRPSTSSAPLPGTPGAALKSPLPPMFLSHLQEPQTPRTVTVSYEPNYEQMFTPKQSEFPRTPSFPSTDTDQKGRVNSSAGLSIPGDAKGNKQRRRESSMMFMMGGGMRSKNSFPVPKAMVVEDSVYE